MLKKALVLLLISNVLYSQQQPSVKTNPEPCPDEKQLPTLSLSVNQRHDLLRRRRAEEVAVILCSPQLAHVGCGVPAHPPLNGAIPISLSIDFPQGITISYRHGRKYVKLTSGTSAPFQRKSGVLLLRVTAGDNVPLGVQRLHGALKYETDESGKPRTTQTIEFNFPFNVVAHSATVAENEWPYGSRIGQHVKDVALAPLVPFQFILFVIGCGISPCDI